MAWRYKITAVNPLADKDYLDFDVQFSNSTAGDGRTYNKTYRIYIDDVADVTIATLKAIVDADLAKIIKFDAISATLTNYIGQYVTA